MNINKKDIKIISIEETTDYEYGKSIVKYSISGKNFISFVFSNQQYNDYNENVVKQEILDFIDPVYIAECLHTILLCHYLRTDIPINPI